MITPNPVVWEGFIHKSSNLSIKDYVEEYKLKIKQYLFRHSKVRKRNKSNECFDTKSTSPETVILINSMKLVFMKRQIIKKEYDAVKEIWSAIMRPRTKLIILEYEGWT